MYNKELNTYVKKYKGKYQYYNKNILFDIVQQIQNIIEFSFEIEDYDPQLLPKLVLAQENIDTDSNKTTAYTKPQLYISLKKRAPVSNDYANSSQTFADANAISGYPRFQKNETREDGRLITHSLMTYDNHLKMVLITKTVKEQLELINILERGLNIYSTLIQPPFITVCGIVSVESNDEKTKTNTMKTIINFHVRTREVVDIDKSYINMGYRIYSGQYHTASGELDKNGTWQNYDTCYDFDYYPDPKKPQK